MIGLILVTHGNLAKELISALEHVVGNQSNIEAICIDPEDNIDNRRKEILEKIKIVDNDAGVILLTDMFGGTPSNLAISIMENNHIEVIAGVNLPMLIKLASVRKTKALTEALIDAQEAGRKYITVASQLLQQEKS